MLPLMCVSDCAMAALNTNQKGWLLLLVPGMKVGDLLGTLWLYDGHGQLLSQDLHWFKVLGFLSFILFPHLSLLLRAEVNPACQGMLSPLLKTPLHSMWEMFGNSCRARLVLSPGVAVSALGQAKWGSVLCLFIICSMLTGLRTAQM